MALLGTEQELLWPGALNPGGGGLKFELLQTIQRSFSGSLSNYSATDTLAKAADLSTTVAILENIVTGLDGTFYSIGVGAWLSNANTLSWLANTGTGTWPSGPTSTFTAGIWKISGAKSIQVKQGSASNITLGTAVTIAKTRILSAWACAGFGQSNLRPYLVDTQTLNINSPSTMTFNTTGRFVIVEGK